MIFEFDKDDDLTVELRKKEYPVTDYFVSNTAIPMGYTVMMKHLQFVYLVKEHNVIIIDFFSHGNLDNPAHAIHDIKNFVSIVKSISGLNSLMFMVNPYPPEEKKKNQENMLKLADDLGFEFIESSPVNFTILDLSGSSAQKQGIQKHA